MGRLVDVVAELVRGQERAMKESNELMKKVVDHLNTVCGELYDVGGRLANIDNNVGWAVARVFPKKRGSQEDEDRIVEVRDEEMEE